MTLTMSSAERQREEKWRNAKIAEEIALNRYGGRRHRPFLNGEEIKKNAEGCSVPDLVREHDGTIEAIEVKYIDFANGLNDEFTTYRKIQRQIATRTKNLPKGTNQRVFILARNRIMPKETIKSILAEMLKDICEHIAIDIEDVKEG